ncbi:unnamed protein product [Amoebophrya sp. A120]|nr:unnamed protein product [Amoebophrya sp. A120]|eukprot:GSA120T00017323001.1
MKRMDTIEAQTQSLEEFALKEPEKVPALAKDLAIAVEEFAKEMIQHLNEEEMAIVPLLSIAKTSGSAGSRLVTRFEPPDTDLQSTKRKERRCALFCQMASLSATRLTCHFAKSVHLSCCPAVQGTGRKCKCQHDLLPKGLFRTQTAQTYSQSIVAPRSHHAKGGGQDRGQDREGLGTGWREDGASVDYRRNGPIRSDAGKEVQEGVPRFPASAVRRRKIKSPPSCVGCLFGHTLSLCDSKPVRKSTFFHQVLKRTQNS